MTNNLKYIGVHNIHNNLTLKKEALLILGSSSPRRIELLKDITENFIVFKPYVDEENILKKSLNTYKNLSFVESAFLACSDIALEKAKYISKNNNNSTVISADTIVVTANKILGKPKNDKDAYNTLISLLGKFHYVATSVCIYNSINNYDLFYVVSSVKFVERDNLSTYFVNEYVNSKKPLDKAGSYGIQEIGSRLVDSIYGDYYNIIGFPIVEIRRRLYENFS